MQRIRCYDCGKTYNYDEDCFCPNCGAFNQPGRKLRIGSDGSVVRVDGINESNHAGSFVHQELHEEKRERRRIGLDKSVQRIQRTVSRPAASRPAPAAGFQSRDRRRSQGKSPVGILAWILILLMLFSLLPRILLAL